MNTSSLSETVSTASKKPDILLVVLLALSLSLNVYLGLKIKRQKSPPSGPENSITLSPGMSVAPVKAITLGGPQETISYASKPTVLYVFSPQCGWCERNTQNINAIAKLKGDSFWFIGISLSDQNLAKYLDSDGLNFPVYKNPTPDTVRLLGLSSTPQTIIVSPEGRVVQNWIGAFGSKLQSQVEGYFNVSLPGLTADRNQPRP